LRYSRTKKIVDLKYYPLITLIVANRLFLINKLIIIREIRVIRGQKTIR